MLRSALAISDVLPSTGEAPTKKNDQDETGPPVVAEELVQLMQQCMPKSVATLARALLSAALVSDTDGCAAAALAAISKLKEEWTEVVRSQAIRGLERRLDSLTYELQKRPMPTIRSGSDERAQPPGTVGQRQASHDNLIVLTALCEALAAAGAQVEERSRNSDFALGELGSRLGKLAITADEHVPSSAKGCSQAGPNPLYAPPQDYTENVLSEHISGGAEHEHHTACDGPENVAADIGEAKTTSAMVSRRTDILKERSQLLARLQQLDSELHLLDAQLGLEPCHSGCSSTQAPSAQSSDKISRGSECSSERSCEPSPTPMALLLAREIMGQISCVSDMLSNEAERSGERFRCMLHQRRLQILTSLSSHIIFEGAHLSSMMPCGAAARSGRPLTTESVESAKSRMQELCRRVEGVLPGARLLPKVARVGARCRAKWMDGKFYDAEVQSILSDGSVLINWLRSLPELDLGYPMRHGGPAPQQLVTVSNRGGDDTLHRIVLQQDVHLVGMGSINDPPNDVKEAQQLFNNRSPVDLLCVDCGSEGADWASVSFGIYLCALCASVHKGCASRSSLLRPLDDGWGWPALDLVPLRLGGNAAFRESLEGFPLLKDAPVADRYSSRFAEYYRRQLDALCASMQPPQPPLVESAAAPINSDFVSAAEAAAAAHEATQQFFDIAAVARDRLPSGKLGRSGSTPQGRLSMGL
jgi:hypothetical protein